LGSGTAQETLDVNESRFLIEAMAVNALEGVGPPTSQIATKYTLRQCFHVLGCRFTSAPVHTRASSRLTGVMMSCHTLPYAGEIRIRIWS